MSTTNDSANKQIRQPRMAAEVKILIGVGVSGLALLLTCGGLVFWQEHQKHTLAENINVADPERVLEVTREIVDIEIPDQFEPDKVTVTPWMKLVMYRDATTKLPALTISEFIGGIPTQQEQDSLRMADLNYHLSLFESTRLGSPRSFPLGDHTIEIEFSVGRPDEKSAARIRVVSGPIPGKSGPAAINIQLREEDYDEAVIVKMIESIRPPPRAQQPN